LQTATHNPKLAISGSSVQCPTQHKVCHFGNCTGADNPQ